MIKRTEWDDDTGTARWSDDGNVGLLVALRRPDLVRKLVFISAPPTSMARRPLLKEMSTALTDPRGGATWQRTVGRSTTKP